MKVLVTGGWGQVGTWVMREAPADVETTSLDLRSSPAVDIRSPVATEMARRADVVIHLAAQVDVQSSLCNPSLTYDVNEAGTANLLQGLGPGQQIVAISSAAIYGDLPGGTVREDAPCRPQSPYGDSKLRAELAVRKFAEERGYDWTILRPFNIYSSIQSERNQYSGVMAAFKRAHRSRAPLRIFGDGKQTRDFVHARDVALAIWQVVGNATAFGSTMNVGTGHGTSILNLASLFCDVLGQDPGREFLPALHGEIRHSVANTGKMQHTLGWTPKTTLIEGLHETLLGGFHNA